MFSTQEQLRQFSSALDSRINTKSQLQMHVVALKEKLKKEKLSKVIFSDWKSRFKRKRKGILLLASLLKSKIDGKMNFFLNLVKSRCKRDSSMNLIFQKLFFTFKKQKILYAWRIWAYRSASKINSLHSERIQKLKQSCRIIKETVKRKQEGILAEVLILFFQGK